MCDMTACYVVPNDPRASRKSFTLAWSYHNISLEHRELCHILEHMPESHARDSVEDLRLKRDALEIGWLDSDIGRLGFDV